MRQINQPSIGTHVEIIIFKWINIGIINFDILNYGILITFPLKYINIQFFPHPLTLWKGKYCKYYPLSCYLIKVTYFLN